MKTCKCCNSKTDTCWKGLCKKCYFMFYHKGLLDDDYSINKYKEILSVKNLINKRPLTRNEVSVLFHGINKGLISKMPSGFWSGIFSFENSITCLEYWCFDLEHYSLEDLTDSAIIESLKTDLKYTPMSNLVYGNFYNFNDLLACVIESFDEALVV